MLVVDDDQHTLEILARILGREGYLCTLARDIAEARALLEGAPYDLIVCDVQVPGGSVLDAFLAVDERFAAGGAGPEVGLPSAIGGTAGSHLAPGAISPREQEVLQLAAYGFSALEIAEALVVSPGTVKTHFQHIYAKLEARDRVAAVATGLRRGLIE